MSSIIRGVLGLFNIKIKHAFIINYLSLVLKIIFILILVKIIMKIFTKVIERFFQNQRKLRFGMSEKKANTLSELLKSIARYGLYIIGAIYIIEALWPNVNTTIALTSVLGVAVGFGSQNLVKDIISGFFILFEDQFAVGDYISIEGKSGEVEALGIRTTKIRDFSGDLHIIPNGSISTVTNKSRGEMRALVEVNLPYEEDLDKAIGVINNVNQLIKDDIEEIKDGPSVLGITGFGEGGVIIRIVAKTDPMKQWDVEYELRKRIKRAFDEKNIKMGYSKKMILDNWGRDS